MAGITLNQAERQELISALVMNCAGWDQEDVDILNNMSDTKIWQHAQGCAQLIANEEEDSGDLPDSLEPSSADEDRGAAEEGDDDQQVSGEEGEAGPTKTHPDAEKKDQPKKCWDEEGNEVDCGDSTASGENVQNEERWLRSAPPRIRSVVINAMNFEHAQKKELVSRITTNRRNRFSDAYLMSMDLEELNALADLAAPNKRPIFAGAPGGPVFNETEVDREDILVAPTLEFTRK